MEKISDWNEFEKKKPLNGQRVLVFTEVGTIYDACYDKTWVNDFVLTDVSSCCLPSVPIRWRPFPEN